MSEAHEDLERAEHAAHGGGHSGNKLIGLTMALIGVLIAFCAALVGSERNELTRTMIEQTQAHSDYTGASTKFRLVMMELEKQRLSPALSASADAATPEVKLAHSVLERFIRLYADYSRERALTKAWSDSFKPVIEAHFAAAEGYERAQLIAEIGIVIASLAVLLANRPAWYISMVLGCICLAQVGRVFLHTRDTVGQSAAKVEQTEEAYQELRKAHVGANEDEKTVDQLDPDGKIRASIGGGEEHPTPDKAEGKAAAPGEHEEKK
jgi:hypothetical protein